MRSILRSLSNHGAVLILVLGSCFPLGAMAQAGVSNAIELLYVSGSGQSAATYAAFSSPLVTQLQPDSGYDTSKPVTVNWQIVSGAATIVESNGTTFSQVVNIPKGSNGAMPPAPTQIHIMAGANSGNVFVRALCVECQSFAATVPGLPYQQNFNLTITQPPPATLSIVSGDGQSGIINSPAAAPLVVQLSSGATPAANQTVNWAVTSGQATLSAATTQTDNNGQTSITFTYGLNTGPVTIQASAATSQVSFSATAFAPATSALSGDNQTGAAGSALQPFVVQVAASCSGCSLNQIPVNWRVLQGGGTLAADQTFTNANGQSSNSLTLGPNPGPNVVQATVAGSGSITFTATATNGVPSGSTLSIMSGANQLLVPKTLSQPMVVKLADASGQAISGANIQWSVSGSTGTLNSTTTPTNSNGQAQNQLIVVLPGAYTVTAQVADSPSIAPVTFNFNNGVANLDGLTPPERAVAHAIDVACPQLAAMSSTAPLPAPQGDLLNRCSEIVVRSGTNPAQVPHALDEMLNSKSIPQRNLAQGVQLGQTSNLNTRLAELRQGVSGISAGGLSLTEDGRSVPLAMFGDLLRKDPQQNGEVGADFERWGFFATGMIQRGGFSAVAANGQPGFDFHNASITAGIDYRFTADFVAGLALGYNNNHSTLDQNTGKVDVDGYSANGYFTWYHNDFYLEGSATLGWLNYDLRRHISYQIDSLDPSGGLTTIDQTAKASPDGHQGSVALSFGKDFNRQAWTFGPYLRGIYSHLHLDGFSETMADPNAPGNGLGTSVEGRSISSVLSVLGARASYAHTYDWGVLVPNALLEWNHEFRNDVENVVSRFLADPTQTPIVLTDTPPDTNYFNIGVGLNAVFPQGRSGFVYFEHLAGYSGAHENRLSMGIRIEF